MRGRLSDDVIEEVRSGNDIVELISEFFPLRKQGKNFVGLCPFHQEKKPSFSVSPDRQIFHCFGCGVGGNIITFLMEYQKMSFLDAVGFLAERAHISLPTREGASGTGSEYEPLYQANHLAAAHYHQQLLQSVDAEKARRYLQQRGFTQEIVKAFRLGYAPPGWDSLIRRAARHKISPEVLFQAGLVLKKEYGEGYYDRFRDRIIFPITNVSGKFIALGGRVLQETDEVKYMNSPETPVYQKGKTLYGLFQNKGAIRKAGLAVIVEGYTDLLSLVQAGVENVVATLGTALTSHQARLLSRYAQEVVLLYDADSAGVAAAQRGIDVLVAAGISTRVLSLPTGMDPDQAIREKGGGFLIEELSTAESFLDFKLRHILARRDPSSVPRKAEALEEVGRTISLIDDALRRGLYLREVAEKMGIDEKLVALAVDKASGRSKRSHKKEARVEELVNRGPELVERKILALLLQNPKMVQRVRGRLSPEDFSQQNHRLIMSRLLEADQGRLQEPANLMNSFSNNGLDSLVAHLCFLQEEGPVDQLVEDHVRKLESNRLVREKQALQEQLRNAQKRNDLPLAKQLTQRLKENAQKRAGSTSSSS